MSEHHCQTLPCMSNRPQAFGSFIATECVCPLLLSAYQPATAIAASASPVLYCPLVPARQAYSHSASVGRRYVFPSIWLSFLQNATASNHDACSTGRSSPCHLLGSVFITATH